MTGWLSPARQALDSAPEPVVLFCRDDDAGWADDRLLALLEVFARYAVPLDLAVIPIALGTDLARVLRVRAEGDPTRVGLHQHGFAHFNHEPDGRKCEFGRRRSAAEQRRDIERGQRRLAELLGPVVQPMFTPPWNRCAPATGRCLLDLAFQVLSRDSTATPLGIPGLGELPVRFDWFARHQGRRLGPMERGRALAAAMLRPGPVGLMFHHAVMDAEEREETVALLDLLAGHPNARCESMWSLAQRSALVPARSNP